MCGSSDAPRTRPRASSEGSAPPSPQFGQMRIGESRAWASVTSLRRGDGRLSGGVVGVAVLDSDPERRKKCVEVLRDAARSIGANIARALAVEGFSNASSCRRRMDERSGPRFRLVLCDGGDVGAAITAAAGLQGVSVVAVQAPSDDDARPTAEQLAALHARIKNSGVPYVDFALFGPYGHRASILRRFEAQVFVDNHLQTRRLKGPSS